MTKSKKGKFSLIHVELPSDDELREVAQGWWDAYSWTYFHSWSPGLAGLSYPFCIVPLSGVMCRRIVSDFIDDGLVGDFSALVSPVLEAMGWGSSFFGKLCSRSPKDVFDGGFVPFSSPEEFLFALVRSMRCFDDLCQLAFLECGYLVLRPWVRIPPECEWRAIVVDGRVAGVSQYHYASDLGITVSGLCRAGGVVSRFVTGSVMPALGRDSFVADVVVDGDSAVLIELNPSWTSDPCLFRSHDNLDGSWMAICGGDVVKVHPGETLVV